MDLRSATPEVEPRLASPLPTAGAAMLMSLLAAAFDEDENSKVAPEELMVLSATAQYG